MTKKESPENKDNYALSSYQGTPKTEDVDNDETINTNKGEQSFLEKIASFFGGREPTPQDDQNLNQTVNDTPSSYILKGSIPSPSHTSQSMCSKGDTFTLTSTVGKRAEQHAGFLDMSRISN